MFVCGAVVGGANSAGRTVKRCSLFVYLYCSNGIVNTIRYAAFRSLLLMPLNVVIRRPLARYGGSSLGNCGRVLVDSRRLPLLYGLKLCRSMSVCLRRTSSFNILRRRALSVGFSLVFIRSPKTHFQI